MPKASPIRSSFNAGELSPLLDGRVDVAKYEAGARVLENFIPAVQGPAVRRAGTRFVAEVKQSASRTWLAKFEFSNTQAYVLEFGDRYLRFYTNHGQLLTGTVAAYNGATAYSVGDLVTSGGVTYYCIAATTGNAPPNATYWYALSGSVYEIPTPYLVADLTDAVDGTFTLSMAQSGDVIYIAHPSYPLQKLSRFSATRWTIAPVTFLNGPFKAQNTTRTRTVYASAATGTVTLTASSALFSAAMVGSYVYLEPADLSSIKPWTAGQEYTVSPLNELRRSDGKTYKCTTTGAPTASKAWRTGPDKPVHTYGTVADGDGGAKIGTNIEREGLDWLFVDGGYGYVRITGFTSATQVTATVLGDWGLPAGVVGAGNATFRWALGAFSAVEGYPSKVTFFRERLTLAKGQDLYFSVAGDYENFAAKDDSGQVVADRAIQATISSEQVNTIQWLLPAQALLIGTTGGEFVCAENATSEPFAPGNLKIEQQTGEGSRAITPLKVGASVLMVQTSGRKVKELAYAIQQQSYLANDLTVLAEHVTRTGIQQVAWHREPYVAMWASRADGQLLGFTFNKEQDVVGWHRHVLGGGYSPPQATFWNLYRWADGTFRSYPEGGLLPVEPALSEVPAFNTSPPTKIVDPSLTPNGSTIFATIPDAVATANPGDIIGVAAGTHNVTVLVTRSGTASQPIYIQALDPNNKPVIDGQMTLPVGWNESGYQAGSTHLVAIAASHIVWDSIDIINSRIQGLNIGPADNNGYFLQNVNTWFSNVKVYRTRIQKCNNRGFQTINTDGVTVGGVTILETCRGSDSLWNSTTENPTGWTAAMQLCGKNVSIIESTIAQALGEGIHAGQHISYGAGAFLQVENLVIRNCRVFDTWSAAIYVTATDGGTIERNVVYQTADTRFWRGRSAAPVYPTYCIHLASEAGRGPEYNPAPWSTGYIGSVNVTIRNNVVWGGLRLIALTEEPNQLYQNITIEHNTLFGAQAATYPAGSGALCNGMTNLTNLTLRNNLIYDAAGRVVATDPGFNAVLGTFTKSNNLWSAAPPVLLQGAGDVTNASVGLTNASYVPSGAWPNISSFDTESFKLTATSPALGAGATGTGVATDFFGAARPATPDIGAHERTP